MFLDKISEFSGTDRWTNIVTGKPREGSDLLQTETDLQKRILKLKDLVRITDLQEYLSTKLVVSTASHDLTDTLQSQEKNN